MATAANEERERGCEMCAGSGRVVVGGYGADDEGDTGTCDDCKGTGRIDDGTLDPLRLAVLSDECRLRRQRRVENSESQ